MSRLSGEECCAPLSSGRIPIFLDKGLSGLDNSRICVSSGVIRATECDTAGQRYGAEAWIPKDPWNRQTYNLIDSNLAPPCASLGKNFVGLIPIPWQVVERLRQTLLMQRLGNTDYGREIAAAGELLAAHFRQACGPATDVAVNGPHSNSGGLITVTEDRARGEYIGLHLDSWDRSPLEARDVSRNRISVNIGPRDRYLVFIDLTLQGMLHALSVAGVEDALPISEIGPAYMRSFSSIPVLRLRIRPGEAYIAPTENFIHDGSTSGALEASSNFTIRGHFDWEQRANEAWMLKLHGL